MTRPIASFGGLSRRHKTALFVLLAALLTFPGCAMLDTSYRDVRSDAMAALAEQGATAKDVDGSGMLSVMDAVSEDRASATAVPPSIVANLGGMLGLSGSAVQAILATLGITGAGAGGIGLMKSAKARRAAQDAIAAQDGPSRAQAQVDAVQARVARLEGAVFNPEAGSA